MKPWVTCGEEDVAEGRLREHVLRVHSEHLGWGDDTTYIYIQAHYYFEPILSLVLLSVIDEAKHWR